MLSNGTARRRHHAGSAVAGYDGDDTRRSRRSRFKLRSHNKGDSKHHYRSSSATDCYAQLLLWFIVFAAALIALYVILLLVVAITLREDSESPKSIKNQSSPMLRGQKKKKMLRAKIFQHTCEDGSKVNYYGSNFHQSSTFLMNDNYCDCEDGSDEPLTSACSHIRVQQRILPNCKDVDGAPVVMYASRISDSIVDCTDETDEI